MARTRISPVRVNPVFIHPEERRMSLDGSWNFRLDPEDKGKAKRWFEGAGTLKDLIKVPGCWQGQGFGGDGKDIVRDFGLEARTFRATYKGTGWYIMDVYPYRKDGFGALQQCVTNTKRFLGMAHTFQKGDLYKSLEKMDAVTAGKVLWKSLFRNR